MNTITITADYIKHKGNKVLLLKFPYNQQVINCIKQHPEAAWSNTNKAWHVPYSAENVQQVKDLLAQKATIDFTVIDEKLEKQKRLPPDIKDFSLSNENTALIAKFKSFLQSRRYSDNTIDIYTDALTVFLKYYSHKPACDINNDDLIAFNTNYIIANKYSASYQNQVVNAVKLFFRTIQNTHLNIELIHRPKNPKLLPNVLSKEEIKKLLEAPSNIKHKAMLSLIYSCGLRRSELLNLKITDIDSKRNLIVVRQSKGKKDRIVPLSLKILELLRSYFVAYQPKIWLFEGQDKMSRYDERSLASVLKQALEKTQINKPVSLHWLRHSYATHLLENGTDLRYIQEILGHSRSKTTEIYTHVSNKSIQRIISPFDTL